MSKWYGKTWKTLTNTGKLLSSTEALDKFDRKFRSLEVTKACPAKLPKDIVKDAKKIFDNDDPFRNIIPAPSFWDSLPSKTSHFYNQIKF